MIQYRKLRINISEIRQNGVLCADPIVAWITQEGIFYPCIGEDYIEIEVPVTADARVELVIQCDDCSICPPIHIIRDLCTTSSDCADCEECVGGFCVPLCPDTLCINDTCVDCIDDDDCEDNLICSGGKCVCPPHMPFQNDKGECVSCLTDSNCPKCTYCLGGECVPLECGDGVCDPTTGECEECINNGNCGVNECCVGNKCECCEGFHWDYDLDVCVEDPECFTEADCGACEGCYGGECVPMQPRQGYIFIEENGECVEYKLCDCENNDCPQGSTCIHHDSEICVCKECTGSCISGECEEGCICDENSICVPNPCQNVACIDGTDCGEGCGCLNGECLPCESISCLTNECAEALGCECVGEQCITIDDKNCEAPCQSAYDCGEGCGCDETQECVDCRLLSCDDDTCANTLGCECVNGQCQENPDEKECDATLTLFKDDTNCDLTATLTNAVACVCPYITPILKLTSFSSNKAGFELSLRKGYGDFPAAIYNLPRLGDFTNPNIADNEVPSSGTFKLYVKVRYANHSALVEKSNTIINVFNTGLVNISNIDIPIIGSTENGSKIVGVEISLVLFSNLVIPNGCTYDAIEPIGSIYITNENQLIVNSTYIYNSITSGDTMLPLFVWRKSTTTNFNDAPFRKIYKSSNSGVYLDTLYGLGEIPSNKENLVDPEGELWSGYNYFVEAICSCAAPAMQPTLYFCTPDLIEYELSNCNKTIRVLDFEPCDVNKDITVFEDDDYDIPSSAQVQYELFLNGATTSVATFEYKDGVGMIVVTDNDQFIEDVTFTNLTPITSIEFKIKNSVQEGSEGCVWLYTEEPVEDREVDRTEECVGSGVRITIPVSNNGFNLVTSPALMTISPQAGSNWSLIGSDYIAVIPKNQSTTITVFYTDNCSKSFIVNKACCDYVAGDVTLAVTGDTCGGAITLTATMNPNLGTPPFAYNYTYPINNGAYTSITHYPISLWTDTLSLPAGSYEAGLLSVQIRDANDCYFNAGTSIQFSNYTIGYTPNFTACRGTNGSVTVTVSPVPITTASINVNNVPYNISSGTLTLSYSNIQTTTTYTYDNLVVDGCSSDVSASTTITVPTLPTITIVPETNNGCTGAAARFRVTTTLPNTVINYHVYQDGSNFNIATGTMTLVSVGVPYYIPAGGIFIDDLINIDITGSHNGCSFGTISSSMTLQGDVPLSIVNDPLYSYVCEDDLLTYSVRVLTSNTAVVTAVNGTPLHITGGYWSVSDIPTGESALITATDAPLCSTTIETNEYTCACGDVEEPVPTQEDYYYCVNTTNDVTMTASEPTGCSVNWYYDVNDPPIVTDNTSCTILNADLDTHIYYVQAVDDVSGCVSDYVAINLVADQVPSVTINPPVDLCLLSSVQFSSTVVYNGANSPTYQWAVTNGTGVATITAGATSGTVTLSLDTEGTFDLTLTVTHETDNGSTCEVEETYAGTIIDCCQGEECLSQFVDIDTGNCDVGLGGDRIYSITADGLDECFITVATYVYAHSATAEWDAFCTALEGYIQNCPELELCDTSNVSVTWSVVSTDNVRITITDSPVNFSTLTIVGSGCPGAYTFDTTGCVAP